MTVLYESINKINEPERKIMIADLVSSGVLEDANGKSVHKLDYHEVRHLAAITELKNEKEDQS